MIEKVEVPLYKELVGEPTRYIIIEEYNDKIMLSLSFEGIYTQVKCDFDDLSRAWQAVRKGP